MSGSVIFVRLRGGSAEQTPVNQRLRNDRARIGAARDEQLDEFVRVGLPRRAHERRSELFRGRVRIQAVVDQEVQHLGIYSSGRREEMLPQVI